MSGQPDLFPVATCDVCGRMLQIMGYSVDAAAFKASYLSCICGATDSTLRYSYTRIVPVSVSPSENRNNG